MASEGKYMAYVGSYSYNGKAKGITVYDVDVEKGTFKERCEVEVDNSSYVTASNDNRTLYSAVSYTHLDVYKRQTLGSAFTLTFWLYVLRTLGLI